MVAIRKPRPLSAEDDRVQLTLGDYIENLPEWMTNPRRKCHGIDPDVFFGSDIARRICHGCPVKKPCLEWALDHYEYGVWGGTSERERRKIRRERNQSGNS